MTIRTTETLKEEAIDRNL